MCDHKYFMFVKIKKVCDIYRVGGGGLRLSVIMTLSVQK